MFDHMVQLLVQLDDDIAHRLEQAVPVRSRKRSEFIRMAIRKALWELEEQATARAYASQPDNEPPYFDASLWEQPAGSTKRRTRKKK